MNCEYYSVGKQSCMCAMLYLLPPSLSSFTCKRPMDPESCCVTFTSSQEAEPPAHTLRVRLCPRWNCLLHCFPVLLFLCPDCGPAHTAFAPSSLGHPIPSPNPVPMSSRCSCPGATGKWVRSGWCGKAGDVDVGCCCCAHSWYLNGGWFLLASPT